MLDASAPHLTWTDLPILGNEAIFSEFGRVHKRYHCPLSRTYYLGKLTVQILDAKAAVLDGMQAGPEKAVAGNCCEDIAKVYSGALRGTDSRRRADPVTPSASAILRPGEKTSQSSDKETGRNCSQAWRFTSCQGCGTATGASRSQKAFLVGAEKPLDGFD